MCQYCGGIIAHDPRCPMYDDSRDETGYICTDCGEPIMKYEPYAKITGKYYHTDCLGNMEIVDLLRLLNCTVEGV